MFARYFKEGNLGCVLKFKQNTIKKDSSRKVNAPYARCVAECKFSGCARYIFCIPTKPTHVQGTDVKVQVKREGNVLHSTEQTHKRHTRQPERETVAEEVNKEGTTENWFNKKLTEMDDIEIDAGNEDKCKNLDVIHKIVSDEKNRSRLAPDVLEEVKLLQEVYCEIDDEEVTHPGYIQYFACDPFKVHLYTQQQFDLYSSMKKKVLYYDVTGSLIKRIPKQKKDVFYHAILMKNPIEGRRGIPLAEMLSNDNHSTEVEHLFARLMDQLASSKPRAKIIPKRVEIDFSWPLLNGILAGVNREDVPRFLSRAYQMLSGENLNTGTHCDYTHPHICSAHMLNNVSQKLKKLHLKKKQKHTYLYLFGMLLDCTSLAEASSVFTHMCVILDSPHRSASLRASKQKISAMLTADCRNFIDTELDDDCNLVEIGDDEGRANTIRGKSPFTKFFQNIRNATEVEQDSSSKSNTQYCPQFLDLFLKDYAGLFPLWSGVLLGNISRHFSEIELQEEPQMRHDTNNYVENWMGTVKKDFKPRSRHTPGAFIRAQYRTVAGLLRQVNLKKPNVTPSKRKRKMQKDTEEKWKKKKSRGKGKYFRKRALDMESSIDEAVQSPVPTKPKYKKETKTHLQNETSKRVNKQNTTPDHRGLSNPATANICWMNSTIQAMKATILADFIRGKWKQLHFKLTLCLV